MRTVINLFVSKHLFFTQRSNKVPIINYFDKKRFMNNKHTIYRIQAIYYIVIIAGKLDLLGTRGVSDLKQLVVNK